MYPLENKPVKVKTEKLNKNKSTEYFEKIININNKNNSNECTNEKLHNFFKMKVNPFISGEKFDLFQFKSRIKKVDLDTESNLARTKTAAENTITNVNNIHLARVNSVQSILPLMPVFEGISISKYFNKNV